MFSLEQKILEQGSGLNGKNIGSTVTGGVAGERDSLLFEVVPALDSTTEAVPARPLITYPETSPTNAQILPEIKGSPANPAEMITDVVPESASGQTTETKLVAFNSSSSDSAQRSVEEVRTSSGKKRIMLMTFSSDDEVSLSSQFTGTIASDYCDIISLTVTSYF